MSTAHLSTPKQQSVHLRLPSCPPAPKRPAQPQSLPANDCMLIDFDLPALPALNLQQLDLSYSTPITLKPRRSNKFPTNLRGRSPWKVCRTVKHSPLRVGRTNLAHGTNLTKTFTNINLAHTTSNNTTNNNSTDKKRMSKLSPPQLVHPPLNRRQQQRTGGRHRSASFSSPAA